MTEELKKRAERRASELESAIAATRERARELIHSLEKERQAWADGWLRVVALLTLESAGV